MNRHDRRAAAAQARKTDKKTSKTGTAKERNDKAWDELNEPRQKCLTVSLLPSQLFPLVTDRSKTSKLTSEQQKSLAEQIKILNADVSSFQTWLDKIHAMHKDKTGSSKNDTEVVETINIGEQYYSWLERYANVVLPTIETALSFFEEEDKPEALEGELIKARQY